MASLKGHAPLREILNGLTSKLNQDKEKNMTEKWKPLKMVHPVEGDIISYCALDSALASQSDVTTFVSALFARWSFSL